MTPYAIADHNGSHLTTEEAVWPVFNDRQEYCGQIYLTAAWAVPQGIYEQLGLLNHVDLFITSVGHWATTLEYAEHYLVHTEPPAEFIVKGASLGFFIPSAWAEDHGSPKTYRDYRVFKNSEGCWDAERIERPLLVEAFEKV